MNDSSNSVVNYQVVDNVAVITLDYPPVNGLGAALRKGILDGYQNAISDNSVQAIVIASAGRLFCGGADISEFGTDKAFANPTLPDLCNTLEVSDKLIVAAINGMALGGGCELTLASDYRIALESAKIGLPEVNLGILPGAGGTQRMPRLANVELALNMVVSGKPESAKVMHEAGMIDRLHIDPATFNQAAIDYAKELVANDAPLRDCAQIDVDTSGISDDYFAKFRQSIARRTRGFFAPERCIQTIEAACSLPLEQGLAKERELFMECMNTPHARGQQHAFFAQREATKVPGINPKNTPSRKISKVAIIGSGTMGGGIAMNFLNAGIPTTVLDLDSEALARGISVIEKNYQISAEKGRFSQQQVDECMSLLSSTTEYSDLSDVDLVIEAVFEDMQVKKKVFQTLDDVCKQGAILATNTSTLDVNEIAAQTKRPQDVIGLHFFSPANVMKLLEIVRAEKTADDVVVSAINVAKAIRKIPAVVGVCYGFVGNRMLEPYGRECSRMVLEGADPVKIDKALYDYGMAMGYISMADLAGLDVGYLIRQSRKEHCYDIDPTYAAIADELYKLDRKGQKNGHGFYIYKGREKLEDPEVMEIAAKLADKFNVAQREISNQEIIERSFYTMINEGADILQEGIAYRSSDIDLIYCNGYGYPVYRGGPMQYADEIGLQTVLDGMNKYRKQLGEYGELWFKPSPLLEKLAAEGKTFKEYTVS